MASGSLIFMLMSRFQINRRFLVQQPDINSDPQLSTYCPVNSFLFQLTIFCYWCFPKEANFITGKQKKSTASNLKSKCKIILAKAVRMNIFDLPFGSQIGMKSGKII